MAPWAAMGVSWQDAVAGAMAGAAAKTATAPMERVKLVSSGAAKGSDRPWESQGCHGKSHLEIFFLGYVLRF